MGLRPRFRVLILLSISMPSILLLVIEMKQASSERERSEWSLGSVALHLSKTASGIGRKGAQPIATEQGGLFRSQGRGR